MSENKNNLVCISGVRGYEEDGVAYLHIEDSARGLGFTTTTEKNGVEYTNVRWSRVEECLQDLNFLPQVAENENPHDYYIPENIFYRLCMKAKNDVAEAFQAKVADEIIPSIRKTGGYGIHTVDDMINDPDTAIRLLTQLKIMRLQNKQLEMERDEAIRTKCHFVEGRDAKVCGELGGLRTQNEALRKQIGDSKTYKAATAISWLPDYFDMSNRGLYVSIAAKLKKLEAEMPPAFAHIDIQDSRWDSVKAYHVAVIERLHEMVQSDENLMKKYRKVASV